LFLQTLSKTNLTALKRLAFSCCKLTEVSAIALSKTLPFLQKLVLAGNNIGDTGALALAAVLNDRACEFVNLNINSCCIGDDSITAIAEAIKQNTVLREIRIDFNNFHQSIGLVSVLDAISWNRSLELLSIHQCQGFFSSPEICKICLDAIEKNGCVRKLLANDDLQ
jgi:Leucine-rich repeat (LRR) protein